jgi:PST family polysaccharide transporter
MAWAYGAYVGGRLLVLAATVVLARLLTPAEFGLVALALTFMIFMDAARDLGLGQALIVSERGEEEERAQTAFGWGVTIGLCLSLATAAVAPLAARFFDEPELTGLLAALGANFFLRSLGATHLAIARKALNYRVRTVSEIADASVRGVVGIGLALLDFGAWSLVLGYLAGSLTSSTALWLLVPFRPRARLTRAHLRDMLSFGGTLTIVDIGAVLAYNLDYVFIGRVLGASSLGLYSIGFRLPELVVMNIATVAGEVLFPAYAAVDRARVRDAYLSALRYTAMLTVPLAAALIVLAQPLVAVLFGDQWDRSGPVMQVLACYALVVALSIPAGTVFKVTRQAWILVAVTIPFLVLLVVALTIFTDQGIMAVATCTTALEAIGLPILTVIASRRLAVPVRASIAAVAPAVLAALGMAAAMLPCAELIDAPLPALLAGGSLGLAVYLGLLVAFAGEDLRRLRRIAFPGAPAS